MIVLRAVFVLALAVVAATFIVGEEAASGRITWFTHNADLLLICCLGVALVVIASDIFLLKKSLKAISGMFFGIVVGMVFGALWGVALFAMAPLLGYTALRWGEGRQALRELFSYQSFRRRRGGLVALLAARRQALARNVMDAVEAVS